MTVGTNSFQAHRRGIGREPWLVAGAVVLALVVAVGGAVIYGLAAHARLAAIGQVLAQPYVWQVVRFTLLQATLSTILSVGLAIPFARACARRGHLPVVAWIMRLAGLGFVTPVIIAVFGIVEVHGTAGWVGRLAAWYSLEPGAYVYGLGGILLAHIYFNMALAARGFASRLGAITPESWRLASQLGMSGGQIFRLIEWPALAPMIAPVAAIIFALTFTSFAVVLTLGGGPAATTIEVAIYQALRFDFDINAAVGLAVLQLALTTTLVAGILSRTRRFPVGQSLHDGFPRPDRAGLRAMAADGVGFTLGAVFILAPLAGVVVPALGALRPHALFDPDLWRAAGWSLGLGLVSGAIAFAAGVALLFATCELGARRGFAKSAIGLEGAASMILVVPPMLLGAGLFLALRGWLDVFAIGPWLVILVNALMGLPFVLRILGPEILRSAQENDRLATALGLAGLNRWRLVDWPDIRKTAGVALGLAVTLSAGDLGVIALFGTPDTTTLPLLIFQRMSAYRMDEAAAGIVVLISLCAVLFAGLERWVGGRHA
ncbi:MAG: thiamine/thiamine pyrophosphate ABC transporter permease ThiP [Alphaproteobacteria bacterium]